MWPPQVGNYSLIAWLSCFYHIEIYRVLLKCSQSHTFMTRWVITYNVSITQVASLTNTSRQFLFQTETLVGTKDNSLQNSWSPKQQSQDQQSKCKEKVTKVICDSPETAKWFLESWRTIAHDGPQVHPRVWDGQSQRCRALITSPTWALPMTTLRKRQGDNRVAPPSGA